MTARRDTTAPHSSACRSTLMPIFCKTSLATDASAQIEGIVVATVDDANEAELVELVATVDGVVCLLTGNYLIGTMLLSEEEE